MEQLGASSQNHEQANDNEFDQGVKNSNSSSYLCRQSSTRWSPTSEQIRILKDLYYNNGVRSPTAEQIQRISSKLRQYGKIEGKNVFYWFQNHKARERQKKRFTTSVDIIQRPPLLPNPKYHHHQDHHITSSFYKNNIINTPPPPTASNFPSSSSSSPALLTVGNYGYGSLSMENRFRECSITSSSSGGSMGQHRNFTWIGVDPYSSSSSPYPFLGVDHQTLEMEEEEEGEEEIETLPLFPIHGRIKQVQETITDHYNNYLNAIANSTPAAGSRASLELTLNSYAAGFRTTS